MRAEEFLAETEQWWREYNPESHNDYHSETRCYYALPGGSSEVAEIYCGPVRHYPEGGSIGGTGPWDRFSLEGFPVDGGSELDSDSLKSYGIGSSLAPDVVLVRPDGRKPPKDAETWSKDRRR